MVDDLCVIKTVTTEAINHDPAITYIQTGFQNPRPAVRRFLAQLRPGQRQRKPPAFVVMISSGRESDQPLFARLWSAGFMESQYQGVQFRGGGDPVLYL